MTLIAGLLGAAALGALATWALLSRSRSAGAPYERALDQMPDSVIITDVGGRIVYVNSAFERRAGFTRSEAVGRKPSIVKSGRHLPEFYQRLWKMLSAGEDFQGEFINRGKDGALYGEETVIAPVRAPGGPVTHYIATARDLTERRRIDRKLDELGNYDSLTGLLSQRLIREQAVQAFALGRRHGYTVALLYLDLDGFQRLNDAFGRAGGDEVLRAVANRLRETLRESDAVARLSGDDFAVLLTEVTDEESVARVVRRLRAALAAPLVIEGRTVRLQVSVGSALYPQDTTEFEQLLTFAETALERARAEGSGFEFFRREVSSFARDRLQLEEDLHEASEMNAFVLHYQPILGAHSGEIVGAEALARGQPVGLEALARWPHVRRGMVPPSEFIPLAEQTGRIVGLDRWALGTAVKQAADWSASGWTGWVAVNLSVRSLQDPQLAEFVHRTVLQNGLDPARLVLEVTESAVVRDVALTARVLRRLKDVGVRIAVDDFGIGQSSLAYLKHFPVDLLKLDHSFIRDIGASSRDEELVDVMITLAHRLGAEIVAEGVEQSRQLDWLRAAGCDLIQGFLVGRPAPAEEVRPVI
jgi:diguanylate cyclase (GGDEF)-like protein/PAS domain S-box-containing protein